jgi:hypothetical protein
MKHSPNKAAYCEIGFFPLHVGIALTKKAYDKEVSRLGVKNPLPFIPPEGAAAMHTFWVGDRYPTCLICIDCAQIAADKRPYLEVVGLITHECVHVAQRLWETVGEEKVGMETEAYFIQHLVQFCLGYIDNFKGKKK